MRECERDWITRSMRQKLIKKIAKFFGTGGQ